MGLHGWSASLAQTVNQSSERFYLKNNKIWWRDIETSVSGVLKHPYRHAHLCAHMGPHTPLTAETPDKLES